MVGTQMLLLRLDFAAFKWDVRFGAGLVLCMLIALATSSQELATSSEQTTTTTTTKAHQAHSESSHSIGDFRLGGSESYYASVNRILRSNDATFRSQDVRWKQVVSRDAMERRRLYKRAVIQPLTSNLSHRDEDGHSNQMANIEIKPKSENTKTKTMKKIDRLAKSGADKHNTKEDFTNARIVSLDLQKNFTNTTRGYFNMTKDTNNSETRANLSCHQIEQLHTENILSNTTQHLDLSCNLISTTDQIVLNDPSSNLVSLDLSHNQLQHIGSQLFRNTTNLTHLNLTNNRLLAISRSDFDKLRRLETLRLGHNGLVHVAPDTFADLVNLQLLDLSYNAIDAAAVRALQGIPALRALSVAFNSNLGWALQEFVASWSLKELDASGTGLCAIPAALAQSVHTLNVSHNHFEIVRCGDLDSYPLLKYLDLSHNEIADIEDDALGRLEILVTLHLHDNHITAVPSSLPSSLVHLYLQNNQIADIQPTVFAQLDNLQTLDLSGNQLTYLPGLPLPRLLTLNLRTSGLRGLSQSVVKTSPDLKDLLLEGNPIKCTDLMGIAEWTTACRSEVPTEPTGDSHYPTLPPGIGGLLESVLASETCCGRPVVYNHNSLMVQSKTVSCKREATRKPPDALVKPKKRSRKAKMEEIWRALSLSNFTAAKEEKETTTSQIPSTSQHIDKHQNNTMSIENQHERPATSEAGPTVPTTQNRTIFPLANDATLKNIPTNYDNHHQQQLHSTTSRPNNIAENKNKLLHTTTTTTSTLTTAPDKKNNKFKPPPSPSSTSSSTTTISTTEFPLKVGQLEINSNPSEALLPTRISSQAITTLTRNPKETVTTPNTISVSSLAALNLVVDDDDDVDESQRLASHSLTPSFGGRRTTKMSKATTAETAAASRTANGPIGVTSPSHSERQRFDNNQRSENKPTINPTGPLHTKHADWNTNKAQADGVNEVGGLGGGASDRREDFDDRNSANRLNENQTDNNNSLIKAVVNHADIIMSDKRRPSVAIGSQDYVSDGAHISGKDETIPTKTNKDDHHPKGATNTKTALDDINNIYVAEQSLVAAEITSMDAKPSSQHNANVVPASLNIALKDKDIEQLKLIPKNINEERIVVSAPAEAPAVIVHSSHHRHNRMDTTDHTTNNNNGGIQRIITGPDGTSTSSGLPEQWNAVRVTSSGGHPGLFVVMGVTIGMFATLILVQVYRCARPWHRRTIEANGDEDDPAGSTHRDMLPMELLGNNSRTTIQYTEAPIELW